MSDTGYTRSQERPSPKANGGGADDPPAILFKPTPFVWRDPKEIKRRSWLYVRHYQRGYVGVTVGRRDYGKTARVIVEMLSMVTGRDLLDIGKDMMPDRPQRCWYIGEDPREEIERRIVAACAHYKIDKEEIGDRLRSWHSIRIGYRTFWKKLRVFATGSRRSMRLRKHSTICRPHQGMTSKFIARSTLEQECK
jgi:AAA domain